MGATLRDVAKLARVHPGTASRALNPSTRRLVNDETARRVLEAAAQLDYRPNSIARQLKTSRSLTIGVLVPDLMNPLFAAIVRGIQDRLEQAGYTPLIANTDNDPQRERANLEATRARQVDGVITATARLDHEALDEINAGGLPIVLVLRRVEGGMASASADDELGARLAVKHLTDLGHKRIAFLGGPLDIFTGKARWKGFQAGIEEAGLEPMPDDLTLFGNAFTEPEGQRLCRQLLSGRRRYLPRRPTAIVAGNDLMALGCYSVFSEQHLYCPEDISIVGFNDMPFSDRFMPPLTTIRVPQYVMGTTAADLLLDRLIDPKAEPRQIVLEPELVIRTSTAPLDT